MNYPGLQKKFELAGKICLIGVGFAIPISITAYTVLLIATLFFSLCAGNWRQKWNVWKNNQIIIAAVVFFALLVLSISYTTAPWSDIRTALSKYDKLLFILLLAPLLIQEKWKMAAVYAFLAAMVVTLIAAFMKMAGWINIGNGMLGTIFTNHINTGFMMAFAAFILAHRCFSAANYRWVYGILLLVMIFHIFIMNEGRTGYLIFLGLLVLFLWQKFSLQGLLLSLIAAPLLFLTAFFFSAHFHQRIEMIFSDLHNYQHQELYANSIGLRLNFSKNSIHLIEKHPIIGTGVGSFRTQYVQNFPPDPGFADMDNPQNEYLMIMVQLGVVGLMVFLWLMFAIWRSGNNLTPFLGYLAQGMVVAFMLGCLCDTFLYLAVTGYFFMFFAALFCSVPGLELPVESKK